MQSWDIGNLIEVFRFLAPGIIIVFLVNLVRGGPRTEYKFLLLHYVIASIIYLILIHPIFYTSGGVLVPVWLHSILYFLIVPSLAGYVLALLTQTDLLWDWAEKLRLKAKPLTVDAWDYTFGKMLGEGKYIIVTLKNGAHIYGMLGGASFVSSGTERDILLERIYELDKNKQWQLVKPVKSLYIKGEQIALIELIPLNEEDDE